MARRRPPRYLRHTAQNLGYVRSNGKFVYFPGPHGSLESRAAYDQWIETWRREREPGRFHATVADLALEYLEYAEVYYRKHGEQTRVQNVRAALRLLLEAHRHTPICELEVHVLAEWRNSLIGKLDRRCKRKHREISRSYINKVSKIILRMFRWARQKNRITAVQLHDLQQLEMLQANRSGAPEAPKVGEVSDADVDAVLPHLAPQVAAMVELQRCTGARPGEICIMRPCDLTTRTDGVMVYRPARWKTEHLDLEDGVERLIFLGPRSQEILRLWLDRDPDEACFQPREVAAWRREQRRAARKSKVQPSQIDRRKARPKRSPGKQYSENSYAQAIKRACLKAKIPPWTPNQLRKRAATVIQDMHDLDTAAAVLGHRNPTTTKRHYATKAANEKAARAAMNFG
ncbi:MAG: site-specific integrase [Planctomycetaceae bacterium]